MEKRLLIWLGFCLILVARTECRVVDCWEKLLSPERGERIIPLPEAQQPHDIIVEKGKVYVSDKENVLVYSLESGRLLRQIGKRGQGPGEFMIGPLRIALISDRLIVGDLRRFLIFSGAGEYLGLMREPVLLGPYPFLPVGSNFVGFAMDRRQDGSLGAPLGYIYDKEGRPIRQFYGEMPGGPPPPPPPGGPAPAKKQDVPLIQDYADFAVYENKIYVADSRKGLFISVFNENGAPLYTIQHPVEKIKVPRNFKDSILQEAKRRGSKYWDYFNPYVPEFFPAFFSFKIDADKIYLITSRQQEGKSEVIVMDLKGKILEQRFRFPLNPYQYDSLQIFNRSFDIENDQFIWYVYNEKQGCYELHVY